MDALNIQIKVFSYEKNKTTREVENVYFYKNDHLPEVITEMLREMKGKSLFGKNKLGRHSEWISDTNNLVKQIVIECYPLTNKSFLAEALKNYSQTFNEENPELIVYQIFLKEEADKIVLVLNFITRFSYQDGELVDNGIRKALIQQNVNQDGTILMNWKNSEIKKIKTNLLQQQELAEANELNKHKTSQENRLKLVETLTDLDQEIIELTNFIPTISNLEGRVHICQSEVDQVSEQLSSAKDKKVKLDQDSKQLSDVLSSLEQQVQLLKVKMDQVLPSMKIQNEKNYQMKQLAEENELQQLKEKITHIEKANEAVDALVAESLENLAQQAQLESPLQQELAEINKRLVEMSENELNLKQQVKKLDSIILQQNKKYQAECQHFEKVVRQLELDKLDMAKKINNEKIEKNESKDPNLFSITINENKNLLQEKTKLAVTNENEETVSMSLDEKLIEEETTAITPCILEDPFKKTPNWTKTKKMKASEFNEKFRKVQYLEHAWVVHIDLSKKIKQENKELKENQEEILIEEKLKGEINQTEIETFIFNGEAANLRKRVTFKHNRPFTKDRVILSNDDYQLLLDKARQYELLDYMNRKMTVKVKDQA